MRNIGDPFNPLLFSLIVSASLGVEQLVGSLMLTGHLCSFQQIGSHGKRSLLPPPQLTFFHSALVVSH